MEQKSEKSRGVMAFIRGDISEELLEIHEDIADEVSRLEQIRNKLTSGNKEVIKSVIEEIIAEEIEEMPAETPVIDMLHNMSDLEHIHTPLLETSATARIPAWLYGEAGSGKSSAAENLADDFKLEFRSISLCPTTSKSDLMGYRDATGKYNRTAFRDTYENGGVFLFDEIDNAHPSSLAIINHALANDVAEFPDKQIERHPDAVIVAAANTIGRGANAQYVGRAVIDAATRDRFVFIPWDIDDDLEERIIGVDIDGRTPQINISEGGIPKPVEWLRIVRSHRDAIELLGIRHLSSPRATIYGVQLARLGMGRRWLKEICIYKGMPESDRIKINNQIG
jgi:cobaltochelatase CobS